MSKKSFKDSKKEQDQWVMFLPDASIKADEGNSTFCQLKHPRTGQGCMFLFTSGNKCIYEVLKFNEKHRSWFIGDSVQSDGSVCIPTPVDPVFLVLPYLIHASQSGKFMQLEQIVEDTDFPECNRLFSCEALKHVEQVCEIKGADDYKVYRYSEDKTMKWLKAKVVKLASVLHDKKIQTSHKGSHSSTFVVSSKSTGASQSELLRFAHGLVSEYLAVNTGTTLQKYLGIEDIIHEKPHIEEPISKKRKEGDVTPTTDYSKTLTQKEDKTKSAVRPSLKQKQLAKDSSGMKSISSFFSPKAKK